MLNSVRAWPNLDRQPVGGAGEQGSVGEKGPPTVTSWAGVLYRAFYLVAASSAIVWCIYNIENIQYYIYTIDDDQCCCCAKTRSHDAPMIRTTQCTWWQYVAA